jgi:hypothetical protein
MSQPPDEPRAPSRPSRTDITRRVALIRGWLDRRLSPEQHAWLDTQVHEIATGTKITALATAIGLAPRHLGKAELTLGDAEAGDAQALVPGLDTTGWSIEQAARMLFLLASFDGDEGAFAARLEALLRSGEIGEHIALLRGLPLYPAPDGLVPLAGEGIRSAVQPVFEAVAHNSPFPALHFSEPMWNQMVVKALFIGSRLAPIQGLDERRNADLARMLVDYAHERWAARRPVSPELWRCVGPFADEAVVADMKRLFDKGTAQDRQAAVLALSSSPHPAARSLLEAHRDLARQAASGALTWERVMSHAEPA